MKEANFFLPWPDKKLSANARQHWASLALAKKKARLAAHWAILEAGIGQIKADELHVKLTFYPPDRRRRDADNCLFCEKSRLDALSDVVGIDDSRFIITFSMAGTIEKNGLVKVELTWEDKSGN